MIRLVQLEGYKKTDKEIMFPVDNTTPLGNPFVLGIDGDIEGEILIKYQKWFYNNIVDKSDDGFLNYLNFIEQKSQSSNIALGCHTTLKPCYADIIKDYLINMLESS